MFASGRTITRPFTYDLALAQVDGELARLVRRLARTGRLDDTTFIFTGDHGEGWDAARDAKLRPEFGFRTHYEHITVPLIVSPATRAASPPTARPTFA